MIGKGARIDAGCAILEQLPERMDRGAGYGEHELSHERERRVLTAGQLRRERTKDIVECFDDGGLNLLVYRLRVPFEPGRLHVEHVERGRMFDILRINDD